MNSSLFSSMRHLKGGVVTLIGEGVRAAYRENLLCQGEIRWIGKLTLKYVAYIITQ